MHVSSKTALGTIVLILGADPNRCSRAVLTVRWTHSTFTRVSDAFETAERVRPHAGHLTTNRRSRVRAAGRGRHHRS